MKPRYRKGGYDIQLCRGCGLTQIHPLPDRTTLEQMYDGDYFASSEEGSGYADYAEQEEEYRATFAEDVRRIGDYVAEGTVLDVGCGFGYFVREALKAGYDGYGIDLSREAVEMARRDLGGRVFVGTVNTAPEIQQIRFDVIFASHLIEHITDPVSFVSSLCDHLSDDGIVVLVTPNISSVLARVCRSRWVSFKVPEHVAYYNPRTIRRLFGMAGCETLRVEGAYQYYRVPFVAEKIRNLFAPFDKLIPRIENSTLLGQRIIRVTSGSLRAIARKGNAVETAPHE